MWNLNFLGRNQPPAIAGKIAADVRGANATDADGTMFLKPPQGMESSIKASGGPIGVSKASADDNQVSNGWRLRPFHPKSGGHAKIKEQVIAALRADGVPGVKPLSN